MTNGPAWRGQLPTLETVGFRGDRGSLKPSPSAGTRQAGVVTITQAGSVLEGIDFRGSSLIVEAPDVTIRGCLFDTAGPDWGAIRAQSTRLTVEDCTFDGGGRASKHAGMIVNPLSWPTGRKGGVWTIRRCIFRGSGSDMIHTIAGGLVEENVFYGGGYSPAAHFDAIYSNHLVAPLVIRRNVIDMRGDGGQPGNPGNNCVRLMCAPSEGPAGSESKADVLVTRNLLLGNGLGAFLIHVLRDTENVTVVDNLCDESRYGMLYPVSGGQIIRWAQNFNSATGKAIVPKGVTLIDVPTPEEPPPPPQPPAPPLPDVSLVSVVSADGGGSLITLKVR